MALDRVKALLPPKVRDTVARAYQQRTWLERARYLGRTLAQGQPGHDRVRRVVESNVGAIGKIGASELGALTSYLRYRDESGFAARWTTQSSRLYTNAGVFPDNAMMYNAFARETIDALADIDVLGVWFNPGEARVTQAFAPDAQLVGLRCLEPHLWYNPWFSLLEGKRVLVVNPFVDTIQAQHSQRAKIWRKRPEMNVTYELVTLRTPFCAAIAPSPFRDWQTGLDSLRSQMDKLSYDVAIIGAGAWSLPLAVHAKRQNKVGIHLGGATQFLFGVRGKRWDTHPVHRHFITDAWVRPTERPDALAQIEDGCYW